MKILKKIFISLLVLLVVAAGGVFLYVQHLKPQYSGSITMQGLNAEVEVIFDNYGIPHIYAQNEEDGYYALGYVHAQDRLFQMEIMRRVGGGRLAEILGPDLVKTDQFFRTLGIAVAADESVKIFNKSELKPWKRGALAYIKGINQYLDQGPTPLEFTLLQIPAEKYTPKDMYLIMGYMAFNFAHGFRTDPIATKILKELGPGHLNELAVHWVPGDEMNHIYRASDSLITEEIADAVAGIIDNLPAPFLMGSNSWVIGPGKTKSGSVIFSNDAHIGYSQPSVWYEAHLESPELSLYGNHLAGFPFALLGHSRFASIGLTMFENDDVDFYIEKANPENANQVWENDHWVDLETREETIKIKGEDDFTFTVQISRHGPIVNDAIEDVKALESEPVSVWWAFTKFPNNTVQAAYTFGHVKSMSEAREAAFSIKAPGLNIMYGDADGNIAWWAVAQLHKHPAHVNSKVFLDGASGKDEILGYFTSAENPQSENPPVGYVYSANNQPDSIYLAADSGKGTLFPGYYVPEHRAKRILEYLNTEKEWTVDDVKEMITDVTTPAYPNLATYIMAVLENERVLLSSSNHSAAVALLKKWKGTHNLDDVAPVIYYKLIYNILSNAMVDELGEETFATLLTTHMFKRSIPGLINSVNSPWYDDIETETVETRKAVFTDAFDRTIRDLETQLGPNIEEWTWNRVHFISHIHPIGRKEPFDKLFNVGPFPVKGGNEVINNIGFFMNKEGSYTAVFGPSMRIIIDFADIENSVSVIPTGQSGNVLSDHYADQAAMYNEGTFRKQMMNREEIEGKQIGTLTFQPE